MNSNHIKVFEPKLAIAVLLFVTIILAFPVFGYSNTTLTGDVTGDGISEQVMTTGEELIVSDSMGVLWRLPSTKNLEELKNFNSDGILDIKVSDSYGNSDIFDGEGWQIITNSTSSQSYSPFSTMSEYTPPSGPYADWWWYELIWGSGCWNAKESDPGGYWTQIGQFAVDFDGDKSTHTFSNCCIWHRDWGTAADIGALKIHPDGHINFYYQYFVK